MAGLRCYTLYKATHGTGHNTKVYVHPLALTYFLYTLLSVPSPIPLLTHHHSLTNRPSHTVTLSQTTPHTLSLSHKHPSHTVTLSHTTPQDHTPSLSHVPLLTHIVTLSHTTPQDHTPSLSHVPLLTHIVTLSQTTPHKLSLSRTTPHTPSLSHIPLLTHSLSHTTPHTPSIIKWYSTMLDNLGLDVLGCSFSHMQSHPHTLTLSHPHSLDKESNRC